MKRRDPVERNRRTARDRHSGGMLELLGVVRIRKHLNQKCSSPKDCTTDQSFEIVIDLARRFRTAKGIVAEHREYILRLKAEVFKVRFGSLGTRVLPLSFLTQEPTRSNCSPNGGCERERHR
jgi:hypothetical protein